MSLTAIGKPVARIDGRAKVTGSARYAADFNQKNMAHAVIVSATIGLGRITAIDSEAVKRVPGIVAIITHRNAPRLPYNPHKGSIDPAVGERLHVLEDDQVRFFGQPVALIVADTLDHAERAATALRVTYQATRPVVDPSDPQASSVSPRDAMATMAAVMPRPPSRKRRSRSTAAMTSRARTTTRWSRMRQWRRGMAIA